MPTPSEQIIALLRESGPLNGREIVASLGLKSDYTHRQLWAMVMDERVEITPDIKFALPIRHP